MKLTPKERERLTLFTAAEIARRRKERGVPLNHPESVAYVSDWCIERAREGGSVAEVRSGASQLLGRDDVMEGVPEMIPMIQVEPVFPDGTKLVTIHDPIRSDTALDPTGGDGEGATNDASATHEDRDESGGTNEDGEDGGPES